MRWRARFAKIAIGLGVVSLVLGFLGGIGVLAYFAESFPVWTGLARMPEYDAQGDVARYAPAKTLWDWLNLLLVPLVLTGGGIWFTRSENRQAREIEQNRVAENQRIERDRAQDAILEGYLDQMTELLLSHDLRGSKEGDEVRSVARARTLTVLRGVDEERKATIVQFLYEAQLIGYFNRWDVVDAVVQLRESDLSGVNLSRVNLVSANFAGANFAGANLSGAFLDGSDLSGSNLSGSNLSLIYLNRANLTRANLVGANLTRANLVGANLTRANLVGANLTRADLAWTDLREADLRGADLRGANFTSCRGLTLGQLFGAESLHGATLPDYINPADLGDLWSPPKPKDTPELKP